MQSCLKLLESGKYNLKHCFFFLFWQNEKDSPSSEGRLGFYLRYSGSTVRAGSRGVAVEFEGLRGR